MAKILDDLKADLLQDKATAKGWLSAHKWYFIIGAVTLFVGWLVGRS